MKASPYLIPVIMAAVGLTSLCRAAPAIWKPGADLEELAFPATLGETGVFQDLATLLPTSDLQPYLINIPFWSDHANKQRWIYLPSGTQISFNPSGNWDFPIGTVWVKHFELPVDPANPAVTKRIETRLLVRTAEGVVGRAYKWNEEGTDATLVGRQGESLDIAIVSNTEPTTQTWKIPSTTDCLRCHTAASGYALGTNTRQLNRDYADQDTKPLSQLALWQSLGFFATPLPAPPETLPSFPQLDDTTASLTLLARAYLEVNCAQCHQPAGEGLSFFDTRLDTPLAVAGIVHGEVARPAGDGAEIIMPGQPELSVIYQRMVFRGLGQMPPIGSNAVDPAGIALIKEWIETGLTDSTDWNAWYLPIVRKDTDGVMIHSQNYGYFTVTPGTEFIHHADHGWQYVFASRSESQWTTFIWDFGMQSFLYINPAAFPGWYFRYSDASWLYYFENQGDLRVFYNTVTNTFELIQKG